MPDDAMQHAPSRPPRDVALEPDPNDAPTLAPNCPHCGGSRPPFGRVGEDRQSRICAMTPDCRATMHEQAKALTAWWEDFEARRRDNRAATGVSITWHWDDAAKRWVGAETPPV